LVLCPGFRSIDGIPVKAHVVLCKGDHRQDAQSEIEGLILVCVGHIHDAVIPKVLCNKLLPWVLRMVLNKGRDFEQSNMVL
jgi:hypothetical protein